MKITVESLTKQLKIYAFAVKNWSKKDLAEKAGIAEICLRHIHDDNWNPTFDTMRKLERLIPDDWEFSGIKSIPVSVANNMIYIINCTKNGWIYVGDSTNYETRKSAHVYNLESGTHPNKKMQDDWNEHGKENFIFTPLFKIEHAEDAERKIIELLSRFTNLYNTLKTTQSKENEQ